MYQMIVKLKGLNSKMQLAHQMLKYSMQHVDLCQYFL